MPYETETGSLNTINNALASLMPTIQGGTVDPRDELIVRYAKGTARFSQDKQYITLDLKMYTLTGEEDGTHRAVLQALYKTPQDLLQVPKLPAGPMDQPVGPVPHINPLGQTKAIWNFLDGSSITVVGPSLSHLVPLKDGSFVFCVSTAQLVTGGTGRYEGVVGAHQTLSASYIPAGVDIFSPQVTAFEITNLETFKVIRRRYNRPFTAPGA